MSMGQLLVTVRDHLRIEMNLDDATCGVQLDGTPPPMAGQLYVVIHEGGIGTSGSEQWLEEQYSIQVGLLRRAGQYPADRRGDLLFREKSSLKSLDELESTAKAMHADWTLMAKYNTDVGANDHPPAQMPLFYQGRGPTHMYSPPYEQNNQDSAWIRRDLRFAGMNRKQRQENIA